jgi:hypothetical protein
MIVEDVLAGSFDHGYVTASDSTTITDTKHDWPVNFLSTNGATLIVYTANGMILVRAVASNTANTITVSGWPTTLGVPSKGNRFKLV